MAEAVIRQAVAVVALRTEVPMYLPGVAETLQQEAEMLILQNSGMSVASDAADNVKFSFQTNRLLVSLCSTIPNVVENLMPQLMQVLLAYSARLSLAGYLELKIVLSRCLHWRLGLLNLLFDLQLLQ